MVLIAALEATARQVRTYNGHYYDSLVAVVVGGACVGAYGAVVVFHPIPWWEPHIMIPTCGMIIGNSISGPAVSVDRLLADVSEKKHESETRLAFGASQYEAVLPVVKVSVLAALLPNLNQMAVIGLVSIPGMMTGQLLGGAAPLVAAEYQMAIIWLIFTTAAVSTYIAVHLAVRHAVFDNHHRLTPSKIIKRATGKLTIETALWKLVVDSFSSIMACMKKLCCMCDRRKPRSYDALLSNNSNIHEEFLGKGEIETYEMTKSAQAATSPSSSTRVKVSYTISDNVDVAADIPQINSSHDIGRSFVLLQLTNVNVLSGSEATLFPHSGLSISLKSGERVTFEGPSGIGKTRLLRAIAQLDEPLQGSMQICNGQGVLTDFNATSTPDWRMRVIYVPQALPPLAGSPVSFITECCSFDCRRKFVGAKSILQDVAFLCRDMESQLLLEDGKLDQSWASLSGGERQRAAIGCALILTRSFQNQMEWDARRRPEVVLLLDEPTAACDAVSCLAVEAAIVKSGAACLFITHDDRQATRIAHRRIILTADNGIGSSSQKSESVLIVDDFADV
eukprot:CAMPEP_0170060906 /NCGR_PEP_ID=MMETSP0019_2-20121128/2678_1 /TAXON_ID=98059 /ORGANISM="Dinobryon sp., Strain UTEXLB2267" /LENGTH=563 /DNA_ID=CAMNT_0010266613 /DNA_START=294 /DNA_END=1985 /DNA_ORIENTATION=+